MGSNVGSADGLEVGCSDVGAAGVGLLSVGNGVGSTDGLSVGDNVGSLVIGLVVG